MRIRTRLTIQFTIILVAILFMASIAIYYFSSVYRQHEYFNRLQNKAFTTAILLSEVKNFDVDLLKMINQNTISLFNEKILIINYLNEIVYDNNPEIELNIPEDFVNKVRLQGEVKYRDKQEKKEILGLLYTDRFNRFVVIASAHDVYGLSKLKNLRIVLLIVMLASVGLTFFAGWFYAGQALQPISKVVSEVEEITVSNLHSRVNTGNGTDEIAYLAFTFNNMLERLDAAFQMQRIFVSNASHELRTPLTAITGQIEVTLLKKRNADEYEQILTSLHEDIKNLNHLTNGLLDLAQASFDVSAIKMGSHRIDELLWQSLAEIKKRNSSCKIEIDFKRLPEEESFLKFNCNDYLLKVAFINLMDNACKYSNNGEVKIWLDVNKSGIHIEFEDNGIGIPEGEIGHIFTPFYRANNSWHTKGHGLGLALTEKIIHLHEGLLSVESNLHDGSKFTVYLPQPSPVVI